MALHDELDYLLACDELTSEDWGSLCQVLEIELPNTSTDRRKKFNEEIRHNFGHTLVNIFRDQYSPDYQEIVKGAAEKLDINIKDHHTVVEIEDKIIVEVIDRAKGHIIKEHGPAAWKRIEDEIEREIKSMIERGDLPPGVIEQLKQTRGAAIMAALYAGKLAGFALYQVAAQTFFYIAKFLGLRLGVAVVGPAIGGVLAFLLGPAGFILAALTLIYDLGNTNWKKTIPAVVTVAIYRRKYGMVGNLALAQ